MTDHTPTSWIHYNPERVDYALTESELEQFKASVHNHWKDLTIACVSVPVPCLLNAVSIAGSQQTFTPILAFVLNLIVGLVGLVLSLAFGLAWRHTLVNVNELIERIKNKPKIAVVPTITHIGMLPQAQQGGT